MRLLLINYEYPPLGGGAGNATAHIARALVGLGHRPIVLTARFGEQPPLEEQDGIVVRRVRARRARADRSNMLEMASYVAAAAIALPSLLRSERPDAAIAFFSMPCGPIALLAKWLGRVPYVVSLRGGDVPGTEPGLKRTYAALAPARRLVLRHARAVIANSPGLKALSEAADPVEVGVIPNGVDTDYFVPATHRVAGPFTFLFVGRFQRQKNLRFFLEAIHELRGSPALPFRVVLVGDGPQRPELLRLATALGLDDCVIWHGWSDKVQLLQHYQSADCLVNPSLYEGMPNTVLEAMACALPVLASRVAGNDAVVADGETGVLFELADAGVLAMQMRRLIEDAVPARAMGAAGRRRAIANFSWRQVAQQYAALFAPGAITA